MNPLYSDDQFMVFPGGVVIYLNDCLEQLKKLPDNSVDAVVTDPPAGISFMSKSWDGNKGGREQWSAWLADVMREALRVTKPGGHALVWALPRTSHWTACGLEDAGWQIRDRIVHIFGSGFPKNQDVSKAIDKAAGAERRLVGREKTPFKVDTAGGRGTSLQGSVNGDFSKQVDEHGYRYTEITAPATEAARQWQGWGTALKPAAEDWWLCRKPLNGTVAQNVQTYGTGALNIDGCRIHATDAPAGRTRHGGGIPGNGSSYELPDARPESVAGRWPANVTFDEAAAAELDRQSGTLTSGNLLPGHKRGEGTSSYSGGGGVIRQPYGGDSGGASRFFPVFKYQAKAPTKERPKVEGISGHPTVKPLALMRWLVRLVTPPGGVVLDPFIGSGTTAEACLLEGFSCIGIERDHDYQKLIVERLHKVEISTIVNGSEDARQDIPM